MRASVLIVEYNTRDYLADCLTSLEHSELARDEFEVIVVDNASPTPIDPLIAAFPHVRFVKSRRNLGFAGGNQLALSRARSDCILLLNPDAVAHPAWLHEMLRVLARPDVGVVGCKILYPGTRVLQHAGGVLFANGRSEHLGRDQDDSGQYDEEMEVQYVCGAAIGTRRDVIDAVGFLSPVYFPAYYEETELCVRARRAGYRVVYAPRAVVEHHESVASGGAQTLAYLRRYHESRMRFVYRNYSLRELLTRFVPQEVGYVSRQSAEERRICARSYVKGLLSAFGGADKLPRPEDVVLDTQGSKA